MRIGPVRVMGAGVVLVLCVKEVSVFLCVHNFICMLLVICCICTRGVPRIFERGFLLVMDLRCGGLGAQPPAADECFVFRI